MLKEREEFYRKLICESASLFEVCKKAGIVPTTGNYDTLKKIILKYHVDISHFKRSVGETTRKKEIKEYLHDGIKVNSNKLKNRLLKEGYKERICEKCGRSEWEGEPIPLELHHINGINTDNRLDNLQILCPNCHALTDNYGGKNQKINKKEKKHNTKNYDDIVEASKVEKSIKDIAIKTGHSERTVKKILSKEQIYVNKNKEIKKTNDEKIPLIIESLKRTKSFAGASREFGVSDNAIKKMLIRRGYPSHIKDLLTFIN